MKNRFIKWIALLIFSHQIAFAQEVETVVQAGHYLGVSAVCYSPDGNFIATGSLDKTVKLWRRKDGKEIRSYQGAGSDILKIDIDRQSKLILAIDKDGMLLVWDLATGVPVAKMSPENDRFKCAAFSPDGSKIITGSRRSHISLWDISAGSKLMEYRAVPESIYGDKEFEYPESGSVMFSSDGRYIIAGVADYTVIMWDAASGSEIRKFKKTRSTCSSCIVEAVITPDNRYVISGYSDSLKVFDTGSGKLVRELYGQGGSPENLSVSADGRYLGAIEYGVAEIWDLKSWNLLARAGDYSERRVISMSVSPDGKEFTAGNEKRTADVVSIPSGNRLMTLKGYLNQVDERILTDSYMYWAAMVNEARLSPGGEYIAVGRTGNNARLVDYKTGKVFRTLRGHDAMVISLSFSSDGRYLATGGLDGKAIVWNVETGDSVRVIRFADRKNAIFSVDISADDRFLATADWGGYVIIWDIETGKMIRAVSPHDRNGCYKVKLLPNNVYFISAGLDGKLKLTEIDTGEEIRTFIGHTERINSISLAPSGNQFITAAWDGTVRVWDIASGLQVRKIAAHGGGAYAARFDSSGKYIVSGGDDFLVKLWDAQTGTLVSGLAGHRGGVGDVNITGDLKHIISGSRDGSIRIWDTENKKEMVSLVFMNENDWFVSSPEGYFDASEGAFSSISFVKGTDIFEPAQFFNEFYRPGLYSEIMSNSVTAFRHDLGQAIDRYPPPGIEFILPETGTVLDDAMITCMVKVTNMGGGVKEFKVMQNGKRQEVDFSDLRRMNREGQSAMKTFELNLIPGENEISVSAFSDGDIESVPATVDLVYRGLQRTSDCYVLSIGINKYENESLNLTYAGQDAQAFSDFIGSRGQKLFNEIHSYKLLDRQATKANILDRLDEISKVMKKEDVFIFFYAGHGSMIDNGFYFITTEVTGLYQEDKVKDALFVRDLQEKLKLLPALKQVVFIDACQSGSSVETLAMRGGAEEKALAQLSRSSGIHVMASSESQQQSAEIKSLNHGVFTYVLLEALSGKADGAPMDSKITVYEIKSYIDDQVPEISYRLIRHRQFPSTFSIGHDFPIVMD